MREREAAWEPAHPGSAGQASAGQAGALGGQRGRPSADAASQAATNHRALNHASLWGVKVKFHTGEPAPELCSGYFCLAQSGSDVLLAQSGPLGFHREKWGIMKSYDEQSLAEASGKHWSPPLPEVCKRSNWLRRTSYAPPNWDAPLTFVKFVSVKMLPMRSRRIQNRCKTYQNQILLITLPHFSTETWSLTLSFSFIKATNSVCLSSEVLLKFQPFVLLVHPQAVPRPQLLVP